MRMENVDALFSKYVRNIKKASKPGNWVGLCPFHDEKTPSFSVSPDKQFFHCFGCKESGTALTFLMKFERMEFVEAVETLAKDMGLVVPREKSNRPYVEVDQGIYDALEGAERIYRQQLRGAEIAVEYLKGRGLTGVTARDFGIGYAPEGWQNVSEKLLAEGATNASLALHRMLLVDFVCLAALYPLPEACRAAIGPYHGVRRPVRRPPR